MVGIEHKMLSLRKSRFEKSGVISIAAIAMSALTGCMDCNQHYCSAIRKVGFDIFWIEKACCIDPERRFCEQMVPLIPNMTSAAVEMKIACDQENWNRMRDIWGEIRRLGMPIPFVAYYEDLFCDEETKKGLNSHPFFMPSDIFRLPGVFAAVGEPEPIVVMPGAIESPWMDQTHGRRNLVEAPEVLWETEYILEPGAALIARTWLGEEEFAASGSLAIARNAPHQELWCELSKPTRMRIDLVGTWVAGSIELDASGPFNALKLEADGRGVLCGLVHMDLYLRDDPSISLEGLFEEAWLELPVSFEGDRITLMPDGAIDSLSLFPLVPEIAELLPGFSSDSFSQDDSRGDDVCQNRADASLNTFKGVFPDCFAAGNDDGN